MIYNIVFVIFVLFFVGIVSSKSKGSKVFMLVVDGFIHDYKKYSTNLTNLKTLTETGVHAKRMISAFPSDTWPSMTTLNTGLYTESHGIIQNSFLDIETGKVFSYLDDPRNYENNGWFFKQEPLWLTNQKQGGKSAVYYMPGYYAPKNEKPTYHNDKTDVILAEIPDGQIAINKTINHLHEDDSLNFMMVYVHSPDGEGHKYGKNSSEFKKALENTDRDIIGYTLELLEPYPDVNFILVADHGFIDVNPNLPGKTRVLEHYIINTSYHSNTYGATTTLRPINGYTVDDLMRNLTQLNETGMFRIFRTDVVENQLPEYLHYRNNKNIEPIVILSNPGWYLKHTEAPDPYLGVHGYDIHYKDINTIFFARGPAFKKGVSLEPFESVNIVPLLAHLLGIEANPNNGSLSVFKSVLADEPTNSKTSTKYYTVVQNMLLFLLFIVLKIFFL